MSDVDINKLTVIKLRAELTQRGLDSKGTKSVLLQRLKTAMNREKGLADGENAEDGHDGHADTSVDESKQDTSQEENHDQSVQNEEDSENKSETKENESMEVDKPEEPKKENGSPVKQSPVEKETKAETKNAVKDASPSRIHHYSRHHSPQPKSVAAVKELSPDNVDDNMVGLDNYHSDLNLVIENCQWKAEPLSEGGFAYMWAGAKSNYGVTSGKVAYEVKILKLVDVSVLPEKEKEKHGFRIGYSTIGASLQLGEDKLSYGYADSAKSCTDSEFKNYGETYKEDDVITALLNMESDPIEISFAKNGTHQGIAFTVSKEELGDDQALYPHILSKNIAFEVNYGQKSDNKLPPNYKDYTMIGDLPRNQRVRAPKGPQKRAECEIIMMCGLPGVGKTTWALKHMEENKDKKYVLLGKHDILEKMKINGESRKKLHTGKWEDLVDKASLCLNKLLNMAEGRLRNYILDQTNTFESAQRRKMSPFEGFKRTAIVIVPSEEEYKKRTEKQTEEGNCDVKEDAVKSMKASYVLPSEDSKLFDTVTYVELDKEKAEELVKKLNKENENAKPSHKRSRPYYQDDYRPRRGGPYKRSRGSYGSYGGADYGPNARYPMDRRGPPNYYYGNRGGGGGGYQQQYRPRRGGYSSNYGGGPSPWRQGGYSNWNHRGGYGRGGYSGGGGNYYGGYNR